MKVYDNFKLLLHQRAKYCFYSFKFSKIKLKVLAFVYFKNFKLSVSYLMAGQCKPQKRVVKSMYPLRLLKWRPKGYYLNIELKTVRYT